MDLTFEMWKARVDGIMEGAVGLTSEEIPDWDYWDAWEAGVTPRQAAREALEEAGWVGE